MLQGIILHFDQFVQRQVVLLVMFPVVVYLHFKLLIVRVMVEAGQLHIVIHIQTQRGCKALGRVFLAFVGELLRYFAQIDVKQTLDQFVVFRAPFTHLDRFIGNRTHVTNQLAMVVTIRIVIDTGIDLFGNDTHLTECVHEGMRQTTLADVALSLTDIVVVQLVHIFLTDDEHLGQIIFTLAHPEQFRLHEGGGSETPAGTCRCLVLHRCSRNPAHIRKLIALGHGPHRTHRQGDGKNK